MRRELLFMHMMEAVDQAFAERQPTTAPALLIEIDGDTPDDVARAARHQTGTPSGKTVGSLTCQACIDLLDNHGYVRDEFNEWILIDEVA